MNVEYSEVALIEPLMHSRVILLDRTFVRFSDGGFRKTINTSNIYMFLELIL